MKATSPPPSLFKYCAADIGLRILTTLRVRFTPAGEFNDPFELLPIINPTPQDLDKMTKKHLDLEFAFSGVEQRKPLLKSDYRRFIATNYALQRNYAQKIADSLPKDFNAELRKGMDKNFGIFCLSERNDNLPMWAHYAQEHTGCVLEFDTSHPFFSNPEPHSLRKVSYTDQRPTYQYEAADPDHLYSKSKHWETESEWRMLGDFGKMEKVRTDYGRTIFLTAIPSQALAAVYLGIRMSEPVKEQFRVALRKPGFEKVKAIQVTLHHSEFALVFDA